MADLATPSAALISTIDAGADRPAKDAKDAKDASSRPTKPDEAAFQAELQRAEKEHAAAQEKLNALKAKIDLAQPKNQDSPGAKRRQELQTEITAIRQQQSGFKSSRGDVQGKLTALDSQLKSRIQEQKTKRAQIPWKSVAEIDAEIQRQERVVESGKATILEEKKAIDEQSRLRKQKKVFAGFDEAQKGIEAVKAQIAELKKSMDNPEAKALSAKYDTIDKELKSIRAEQDEAYKGLNALRDERTKAHAHQQEKWTAMRSIKDEYYKARRAFKEHEDKLYHERQARQREERDAYHKEKRKKIAAQKLEEASEPAYMDEILTAEGLIRYFDPSAPEAAKSLLGPSGFAAAAQRSVDADAKISGTRVSKKGDREDDYFVGSGGKKGKKGKRGGAASSPAATPTATSAASDGKFNLSMGIIEELAKIGVEPPMTQADIAGVVGNLKEKRDRWKKDQEAKTKENIAKAQAEITRLDEEARNPASTSSTAHNKSNNNTSTSKSHDSSKKVSEKNQGVNGSGSGTTPSSGAVDPEAELKQERDAEGDVAEEMMGRVALK